MKSSRNKTLDMVNLDWNTKMEIVTKEKSKMNSKTDGVNINMRMAKNIAGVLSRIKFTVMVDIISFLELTMKETGAVVWNMVLEY